MAEQPKIQSKKVVSAADVPALDLPPTFANRFNITMNQTFTRVAFGEFVAGNPENDTNYHTALVIPTAEIVQFANVVLQVHAENLAANAPPPAKAAEDGER